MIGRTKYLLLIIKTYFETKNPSASNPSEPMFDLQMELFKLALIRKQKLIEQKTNIIKEEFLLQCELAAEELYEYGYMQYSIAVNRLNYKELIPDESESEQEQIKIIHRQINNYLVDLSGVDPSFKYTLYNWEIEFIKEIFENINQSSYQSTQIEKIDPIALSSNIVNERIVYISEQNAGMFSNNGFELFKHILNTYVKPIGTSGRKSDLIFYFWKLYNNKPQYIHQRPVKFFNWFESEYDEMTGQLKTFDKVKTIQRERDFSLALEWFKST
jgi:hypothetical protein